MKTKWNKPTIVLVGAILLAATVPSARARSHTATSGLFTVDTKNTTSFDPLPIATYGDSAFELVATATSGLPVFFASSNEAVATVVEADSTWTATLVGAGTTTITASQAGGGDWNWDAAADVTQVLTVEKAVLTVRPDAGQSKIFGAADPVYAYGHAGAVAGETPAFAGALSRPPGEEVGTYAILAGDLALADNTPFLAANYQLAVTDTVAFAVTAKSATTFTVGGVGPFEYTGAAHAPEPTVHDGDTLLVKDTHYTLAHTDNTNAVTATVTVTGIGNYTGAQGSEFEIEAKTLVVTPTADQSKTFGAADPAYAYGHAGAVAGETPAFAGALSRASGEDVGTYAIQAGTLVLADNTPFLAANYELAVTDTVTFAVTAKDAATFTVGTVGPFEYTGAAHTPEPTVHDGTTLLVKDTHYTLAHADNTNAVTATVTVTGIGNYTGTQDEEFEIDQKTLTVTPDTGQSKTFGAADPAYAYGHAGAVAGETPAFAGALSRPPGEDIGTYAIQAGDLALADNTPFLAANYQLAVTDTVTFAVTAKGAATFTVGAVGPFEYTGATHAPEPTAHDGTTLLVKDTHYTLAHTDNTNAGTATVTVTGIGNYAGAQDKTFGIEARTLTVTPDAGQGKIFGVADPVYAYDHAGAVAGETPAFAGALSRAAGEDVGTYAIQAGDLALADNTPFLAANYELAFTDTVTFAVVVPVVVGPPPWYPPIPIPSAPLGRAIVLSFVRVRIADEAGNSELTAVLLIDDAAGELIFRPEDYMTGEDAATAGLLPGTYTPYFAYWVEGAGDFGEEQEGDSFIVSYEAPTAPTGVFYTGAEPQSVPEPGGARFSFQLATAQGYVLEVEAGGTRDLVARLVRPLTRPAEGEAFPAGLAVTDLFIPLVPGDYGWRVRAYNPLAPATPALRAEAWADGNAFTVATPAPAGAPGVPDLLSPGAGIAFNPSVTTGKAMLDFFWTAVPGATGYYIYVGLQKGTAVVNNEKTTETSLRAVSLRPGTYRWAAMAFNATGRSVWSDVGLFTVNATSGPALVTGTHADGNITFDWVGMVPQGVELYIVDEGAYKAWMVSDLPPDQPYTPSGELALPGHTYWFRTRSIGANGDRGVWSDWDVYQIPDAGDQVLVAATPDTTADGQVTFAWNWTNMPAGAQVKIRILRASNFASGVWTDATGDDGLVLAGDAVAAPGETYHYQIRPLDADGKPLNGWTDWLLYTMPGPK